MAAQAAKKGGGHLAALSPWTVARQASLSFTISRSLLKFMSFESVMPSNHLILCRPLLLPHSIFPSTRSGSFLGRPGLQSRTLKPPALCGSSRCHNSTQDPSKDQSLCTDSCSENFLSVALRVTGNCLPRPLELPRGPLLSGPLQKQWCGPKLRPPAPCRTSHIRSSWYPQGLSGLGWPCAREIGACPGV